MPQQARQQLALTGTLIEMKAMQVLHAQAEHKLMHLFHPISLHIRV